MRKYFIITCLIALAAITGNAKTANFKTGVINTLHADDFKECFDDENTLGKPVVIDVSAEWCGWCKKMHPHLEQLAKKYKGQIYFFQINYETDIDLIRELGVNAFPTLIYILPDGTGLLDEQGFRTADELDKTLQEVFYSEDQSSVNPSWPTESWPTQDVASWPTESWPTESWPVASWPTESWPIESWPVASWPTESWPTESWPVASWPTESWPVASWPTESWPTESWPVASWPTESWPIESWPVESWPII